MVCSSSSSSAVAVLWVCLVAGACEDSDAGVDGGSARDAAPGLDGTLSLDGAASDAQVRDAMVPSDARVRDGGARPDAGGARPTFQEDFSGSSNLLSEGYGPWRVLHPGRADTIDVGLAVSGSLTMIPTAQAQNSWFQDQYGPLVYRTVEGDFAAVTRLRVVSRNNPAVRPGVGFNAGGFVLRDPAGTHSADENWVMYNMGAQGPSGVTYAREIKKTLDVGTRTVSNLFLNAQSELAVEGYLKLCRVGDRFTFYHWSGTQSAWREERFYNGVDVDGEQVVTDPNSTSITPEIGSVPPAAGTSVPLFFEHSEMPASIQLGLMAGAWSGDLDTRAEFDFVYVRELTPANMSACESAFRDPRSL